MRRYRQARSLFLWAILCYFLMAATILLMPLTLNSSGRGLATALGISFWLFLALGLALSLLAAAKVKAAMQAQDRLEQWKSWPLGVIGFWKNLPAIVFDCLFPLSVLGVILGNGSALKSHYIMYVLIFLAAFSFPMHCLLNGRTLRYLDTIRKVRKRSHEKH